MTTDGGLRRLFKDRFPEAQLTVIESGMLAPGTPDSEMCFPRGITCWLEFKKTNGNLIPHLKPLQVSWIDRRARLGGRVFVATRLICDAGPRRGAARDELWLIRGDQVKVLKAEGLEAASRGLTWTGGPDSWDWSAVRAALTGPGYG